MTEELPKTSVPAGLFGTLQFDLIPATKLEFAAPDEATRRALTEPQSLALTIPIKGTYLNFPNGTKCQLWWLVKKGNETSNEGPLDAVIATDSDTGFHLTVNGADPKLDLIKHKVVGKGALGYRVVPDFPHATPAEFTPGPLTFDIAFGVEFQKPSPLLIGSKVVFKPHFASLFDKAEVRLEIVERQEAAKAAPGTAWSASAGLCCWKDHRDPYTWTIGFADTSFSRFTFAATDEMGDFEFVWRLTASSGEKDFTSLIENKTDFVGIKKPHLEQFKLNFDHGLGHEEVLAQGKIANFAPETHVEVQVALVTHNLVQHDPAPDWRVSAHSKHLASDGTFAIPMVTKWIFDRVEIPNPEKTFGILTFQAAEMGKGPDGRPLLAVGSALATDGAIHPGFKGSDVCFAPDAEWICSEEVSKLVKSPAQLLDDDLVKRVLYKGGNIDAATNEQLKQILAGATSVQKGKCDEGVAKALNRALIYLGYPTGGAGTYSIDGDFGAGSNFGLALFLRENALHHLADEKDVQITDKRLIFASGGNDESVAALATFPVIPVDKPRLEDFLHMIDSTRRTRHVYLADCAKAIENLDRIEAREFMKAAGIVQRFRSSIEAGVTYAASKQVTIRPQWVAAFMLQETAGVPRPKYEHHVLYHYYCGKPVGGIRNGEVLTNFSECRLMSTSFGLGQIMGFNYKETGASSAFELFTKDEQAQVRMVCDHLIRGAQDHTIREVLASDQVPSIGNPGFGYLCAHYNGDGYKEKGYHTKLHAHYQEVKQAW